MTSFDTVILHFCRLGPAGLAFQGSGHGGLSSGHAAGSAAFSSAVAAVAARCAACALHSRRPGRLPRGSIAEPAGSGLRGHRRAGRPMGDHARPRRIFRRFRLEGRCASSCSVSVFPLFRHSEAVARACFGKLAAFRLGHHDRRRARGNLGSFVHERSHACDQSDVSRRIDAVTP